MADTEIKPFVPPDRPAGDVPVVCTYSGDIRIVDGIAKAELDLHKEAMITEIQTKGVDARIRGRACATCRQIGIGVFCTYRPLVGPLFVPR